MKTITYAKRTLNADLFRSVVVREDKTVIPSYSVEAVFGRAKLYLASFKEKPGTPRIAPDISSPNLLTSISA